MAKSIKADANTMFKNMMKQEAPVETVSNNSNHEKDDMDELDYILEETKEPDNSIEPANLNDKSVLQNKIADKKKNGANIEDNEISEAGYVIYTRKQLMDEVYNNVRGEKKTQNFRMHADGAIENALRLGKKSCGNSFSVYVKKLIAEDYLKNREKYENM